MFRATAVLLCLTALTACRNETVTPSDGRLKVEPDALHFPTTAVGGWVEAPLHFTLLAKYPLHVELTTESPFAVEARSLDLLAGETRRVMVGFSPSGPGPVGGLLQVAYDGVEVSVELSGEGAVPSCAAATQCQVLTPRPGSLECDAQPLPDGTNCHHSCLTAAHCEGGECVGEPVFCAEADACTVAACDVTVGCFSRPRDCEPPSPCQAGLCDPTQGCVFADTVDGTPCGPADCAVAHVCIAGTCQERTSPAGSACTIPWARCVTDALCVDGECQSATAAAYQPGEVLWTRTRGAGGFAGPLTMDDEGNLYLRTNSWGVTSLDACGATRWETPVPYDAMDQSQSWLLVEGDVVVVVNFNQVTGLSRATGALLWTRKLRADFGLCPRSFQPCDLTEVGSFYFDKATVSETGKLHISVLGGVKQGSSYVDTQFFSQLDLSGRLEWTRQFAGPTNSITSVLEGPGDQLSFAGPSWRVLDSTGAVLNRAPPGLGVGSRPVAIGTDSFLSIGAWNRAGTDPFDGGGGSSWTTPSGGAHTARVDEAGRVFLFGPNTTGPEPSFIQRVDPDGGIQLLYSGALWPQSPLLGAGGALHLVLGPPSFDPNAPPAELVTLDSSTGTLRWKTGLQSSYVYSVELALSHDGTLVVLYSGRLMAISAGRQGLSPDAPWPRDHGTNGNTSRRNGH